jgi:hypothetical protein
MGPIPYDKHSIRKIMYLNNYSVRISGHKESGQYVTLNHKEQYTVILGNKSHARCDAEVKIDGRLVGTWRLAPHETLVLERPLNDDGKFTFYRTGSEEAVKVGEHTVGGSEKGLIYVTFVPEKVSHYAVMDGGWDLYTAPTISPLVFGSGGTGDLPVNNVEVSCNTAVNYCQSTTDNYQIRAVNNLAEGVTGLSGQSSQKFVDAGYMTLDYSRQTVIALRLVAASDDPRPLVAYSTPIPPPI